MSGTWRVARSLTTLRLQLNAAHPTRNTASDGTIGDTAHTSTSDHSPHVYSALGSTPVVTAFDCTQDPAHGCDCAVVTEAIRRSRDARVKYVIWDHRMYSSYKSSGGAPAWTWRSYTGSDPHTNHFHLSVLPLAIADDTRPWAIGVDEDMALTPEEYAEIVQGSLTDDNTLAYRLRSILDGSDPALAGYFARGWTHHVGLKQVAETLAKVAADVAELNADVAELKTRPPVQVSATELAAALVADPAFAELLKTAALEGAQRAEDE